MNNLTSNYFSFKEAIIDATPIFFNRENEKSYWSGKKIFLGYSEEKGWKVYELGFFAQIFRKLNLAYRDTHRHSILAKLENLTAEEACFISKSQIAKKLPSLKKKLEEIYHQKVRSKAQTQLLPICTQKSESQMQIIAPEQAEPEEEQPNLREDAAKNLSQNLTKDVVEADGKKWVFKKRSSLSQAHASPKKKKISPSPHKLSFLVSTNIDDIETKSQQNDTKEPESPPVTTPLYLKNFNCTRCYMDSVLEIMLSQNSIRERIFKESAREDLSPEKKDILTALRDLILVVHETKGKGKGNKSPIGRNSPGERIRQAIFASKLNTDLSDFKNIYTQQDAASVVLLINDLLDNSFQTVEIDTGKVKDKKIVAKRPIVTNHKLELRFKNEVKVNSQVNRLIEQILPLLFLEDDTSIDDCNDLMDQLISKLRNKKNQKEDINKLIHDLESFMKGSAINISELFDQLIEFKTHLKTDLHALVHQFFKPELATDFFNKKVTRKFTLPDDTIIDSTYVTQTKLVNLPDLLTLHISRYGFDLQRGPFKENDPVALPQDGIVDMTPYYSGKNEESYKYEIMGYVVHHGESLNSGHYTANVKIGDKFYECDDLNPKPPFHTEISAESFYGNENAYLLMLKRIPNESSP